jgi:phytanoyl-CoA hydroxylase
MVIPATERGSKGYSTDVVVDAAQAEQIRASLYRGVTATPGRILDQLPDPLRIEDVEFFRANGYLAANGVFSAEEVQACKDGLSDLVRRRASWDRRVWAQEEPYFSQNASDGTDIDPELRLRKLAYFVQIEPRLAAASQHPRLMAATHQLIGEGARLIQDMALLKPPFKGSEKPWHQDAAYFDWLPLGGVLGTWIALDEATIENGCMQVMPASHLAGPAPHFHVRDCQIDDKHIQVNRAVPIPLQPGGVLFFSGLLQHGTPPNMTAHRRRALQFHYAAANCTRMTIDQHGELFNVGGVYAGCRDWDLKTGTSRAVLTP